MNLTTKKPAPVIGWAAVGVMLVIIAVLFFLSRPKTKPIDLTMVSGSPEFYDLKWGMSPDEAAKLIKIEHGTTPGRMDETGIHEDAFIYTDEIFKVYGLKAEKVYCGFSGTRLNSVMMVFPKEKEELTLEKVSSILVDVYGAATENNTWVGPLTTIEVWDAQVLDQKEKNIIVRYTRTLNSPFSMLSFDSGTSLDPFGLVDENSVFGTAGADMISGLWEWEDYRRKGEEGVYTTYTLFPHFEYIGLPSGNTAVELYEREGGDGISKVSYVFGLDANDFNERRDGVFEIRDMLTAAYGAPDKCTYAEYELGSFNEEEISFYTGDHMEITAEEYASLMQDKTEGVFHMIWREKDMNVVFFMVINNYEPYPYGNISFTQNIE